MLHGFIGVFRCSMKNAELRCRGFGNNRYQADLLPTRKGTNNEKNARKFEFCVLKMTNLLKRGHAEEYWKPLYC
jgi:hypothetical protein